MDVLSDFSSPPRTPVDAEFKTITKPPLTRILLKFNERQQLATKEYLPSLRLSQLGFRLSKGVV